jgi:hypothetical protein
MAGMLLICADARAQPPQPAPHPTSLEQSLNKFMGTWRNGSYNPDSYTAAFPDLNDDGKPEAIVYYTDDKWCGSGGCSMLVLTQNAAHHSWRIVGHISVTHRPISVLKRTSHGWHSIGVWQSGGRILEPYEAELRFDGKKYPANPSMPPARKMSTPVPEEVVIPNPSLPPARPNPVPDNGAMPIAPLLDSTKQ